LTAQEGSSPKRPHQAFLLLKDAHTGLDISYPFTVKENGKSRVELVRKIRDIASDTADSSQTKKDLPIQFLSLSEPVDARVVIGGLGTSDAYDSSAFQLSIDRNPELAVPTVETERYGKKPEIHHIFKDSPSNPPIMITLAFVAMVGAALPVLAGLVRSYLVSWRQQQLTRYLSSGSFSVLTSATFPLLSSPPRFLTLYSSDLWSPSRESSSSTIPRGTCFRFSPLWPLSARSHLSVEAAHSVRCKVAALLVSAEPPECLENKCPRFGSSATLRASRMNVRAYPVLYLGCCDIPTYFCKSKPLQKYMIETNLRTTLM
jgi:hypothetical protein